LGIIWVEESSGKSSTTTQVLQNSSLLRIFARYLCCHILESHRVLTNRIMANTAPLASAKLNIVQLHLLELFSRAMSEQELLDIKELLVRYYAQKVDAELERVWAKKGFTPDSFKKATQDLHLRAIKRSAT
jgi:hypothetical protein